MPFNISYLRSKQFQCFVFLHFSAWWPSEDLICQQTTSGQTTSICCCDRIQSTGKMQVFAFTSLLLASLVNFVRNLTFKFRLAFRLYCLVVSISVENMDEGWRSRAGNNSTKKRQEMNLSRIEGRKNVQIVGVVGREGGRARKWDPGCSVSFVQWVPNLSCP